jgi:hypothetical protein
MMSPVSRRFVLTGAALTAASLLVPVSLSLRDPRPHSRRHPSRGKNAMRQRE